MDVQLVSRWLLLFDYEERVYVDEDGNLVIINDFGTNVLAMRKLPKD